MCMTSDQRKYLDSNKCQSDQKLAIVQKCNNNACPGPEWNAGEWDTVSSELILRWCVLNRNRECHKM